MLRQRHVVGTAEVQIFEYEKYGTGGDDADNQASFFLGNIIGPPLNENAGRIVNGDGDEQDKDVFGNEPHVEEAARTQQHHPSVTGWQKIEQNCYYREENKKFNRIE
jgi:hypothetical protein